MRIVSLLAAVSLVATPALAAQERALFVRVHGGGADHLADLTTGAPTASFSPGYSLGASVGVQLTRSLAVRGDFTFTRNKAWGATPFAGQDVNRFLYGAHVEVRRPLGAVAPFAFLGAGAVSIDQLGLDEFRPTTRPALIYGGGLLYPIPRTRVEVLGEVKGFAYRWNMAGFHRTMFDVTYAVGVSYRVPF